MKRTGSIVYIVVCLMLCILPFAGMAVYRTEVTTENKTLAEFPGLQKDGHFNMEFFDELSAYFEDHFAFRQELVAADANIQSRIFKVSNVDTVLVGKEGWLYYTDTIDDYLGQNVMTDRQVFNTVHNLSLLQQYVVDRGADFLFTVAPNKNSLYGGNMPYYAGYKVDEVSNIDLIKPRLLEIGIFYTDLYEPFERERETLYLKRDSHWNNKGAVLAYDTLLDSVMMEHETYEGVTALREKREYGDLNKMLYPLAAVPEWNYYYQHDNNWSYCSEEQDVEAAWLETQCPDGKGNLLMFRDSFGNTLIPLMAGQFESAAFSKGIPYRIAEYMEKCSPELVIAEKVERNLDEYMLTPPIMQGPEIMLEEIKEGNDRFDAVIEIEELLDDTNYWIVSGKVEGENIETDARIYVHLINGEISKTYEAFTTVADDSDYGYTLYLQKDELQSTGLVSNNSVRIEILVEDSNGLQHTGEINISLKQP